MSEIDDIYGGTPPVLDFGLYAMNNIAVAQSKVEYGSLPEKDKKNIDLLVDFIVNNNVKRHISVLFRDDDMAEQMEIDANPPAYEMQDIRDTVLSIVTTAFLEGGSLVLRLALSDVQHVLYGFRFEKQHIEALSASNLEKAFVLCGNNEEGVEEIYESAPIIFA